MAKYPFTYYSIAGLVMRVGLSIGLSGFSTLFLTRVVSGMLCYGALIASASMLGRRYGWKPTTLVLLVVTVPNVQFQFSTINPNGFEIAMTVLLASTIIALRHDALHSTRMPLRLEITLLLAILTAGWARPLSIAWTGLLLLILLIPAHGRRPVLFRLRKPMICGVFLLVFFELFWLYYQATGTMTTTSVGEMDEWHALSPLIRLGSIILRFGPMIVQAFGTMGQLDTNVPVLALVIWLVIGVVVIASFATGTRRGDLRPRVAGLVLTGSVLVVVVESYHAAFGWQGRYWLPPVTAALILLIPWLQGRALSARTQMKVWSTAAGMTVFISFSSLIFNMWRYRFGFRSPFIRFSEVPYPWRYPAWTPPGGTTLFYFAAGATSLAFLVACWAFSQSLRRGAASPVEGADASHPADDPTTADVYLPSRPRLTPRSVRDRDDSESRDAGVSESTASDPPHGESTC
jgi:hypothetical protein